MGEKDITEKILEDHNDVFADIINGLIFAGEQRILPESLENTAVHSQYKADDEKVHELERDVAKYWKDQDVQLAICGIENQSSVEKYMPFRIIGYDGTAYRSQLQDKRKEILPVMTIVLYFGTEHCWYGKRNIKGLMKIPEGLDDYINDYKMQVFEVAWLTEEQISRFRSDFKIVANFFVQKRKNKDYIPDDPTEIKHIDETVAIVPMKLNNRRLPQKNTKSFTNGKPLCHYILSTLLTVESVDEVYVYCSNPDIQEFIPERVKYLQRSTSLDQDTTKMNEVLHCFANEVPADIYVMTHTTAPFIKKESIEKGLKAVKSGEYDSSFAAKKLQDFLWKDGKPFNYELNNIPRTQDLPALYEETSGFYIYRNHVMTDLNRRIGDKPFIVEVGEIESVDIDEAEDFMIADAIYNYRFSKSKINFMEKV